MSGSLELPPWKLEYKNLSPSLEDAYGSTAMPTPRIKAKAEEMCQRNFDKLSPLAGLPYRGD